MSQTTLKRLIRNATTWIVQAGFALLCTCSRSPIDVGDGGGTRGGNPVVIGKIVRPGGAAATDVKVTLIAADYNPLTDPPLDSSLMVTTDSTGSFSIKAPDSGTYTIEAKAISDGNRLIRFNIEAFRASTSSLPVDTLHAPGALRISAPKQSSVSERYVYVPGTTIASRLSETNDMVIIDSVPAGVLPALYYITESENNHKSIRYDITIQPLKTTGIENLQWSHCHRIILNTSPNGADVYGDVYNFPVFIRLGSGNFNFSQALSDGSDIVFTNRNGEPLPYETIHWNAVAQNAQLWVKVDTVHGNDSTQSIMMYWGNPEAIKDSHSELVFDTAEGFQGVWHLEEYGNNSALDATANHFNGTAYNMKGITAVEGIAGNARVFDGDSSFITMPNTASGKLNYPENSYFTLSAWVYVDTFDNVYRTIAAKGFHQYYLQLTYFPKDAQWEFSSFTQRDNWHMSNYPATTGKWMLLTGVKQGDSQFLYCNGELVAGTSAVYPQKVDRDTSNDFSIGRFLKEATYPQKFGFCYFRGMIDEVSISSVARNQDWIRLSYMNQRSDDRLVQIK